MKIMNQHIVTAMICLSLTFSGCGAPPSAAPMPELDNSESAANAVNAVAPEVQTEQADTPPKNDVREEAEPPAARVPDAYPSTEEITALVKAEESKLYWCTEMPAYSGSMDMPAVEIPDAETFGAQLSELLGGAYQVTGESDGLPVLTAVPDGTEPDVDTLLSALSQLTGTAYTEITPEEIYTAQYVPEFNGYPVDAEGFFYGGNRSGDLAPGSYVGVSEDGKIKIFCPFIVKASEQSIDASELVTPETVETICRAYCEGQIGSYVVIIKDIALEYYYSDTEESLLPAWRCGMTFYVTENGHDDSFMLDAQTGELLRN